MAAPIAAEAKPAYAFFLRGDVFATVNEDIDEARAGLLASPNVNGLDDIPLPTRALRHDAGCSAPMTGDGKGVISAIAARYGDVSADGVECGESEEAMLLEERVVRSEEPPAATIAVGDATMALALASATLSKTTGAPAPKGVAVEGGVMRVSRCRPALAGDWCRTGL